jgi:glycosyltransferase involved in cell wall biosynthesis
VTVTAERRRRVLILAPGLPWPATNGGMLRTANLVEGLAERFDVHLLCFRRSDGKRRDLPPRGVRVTALPHKRGRVARLWRVLALAASGRPLEYCFYDTREMRQVLEAEARRSDALVVECLSMAGVALSSRLPKRLPKILDSQNAEVERALSICRQLPLGPLKARLLIHLWALRRFERKVVSDFDACVFVAEADRDAVMRAAKEVSVPTFVVPNGVTVGDGANGETAPIDPERPLITFIGSLDYPPNTDAACWLGREILPLMRAAIPGVRVRVIGRRPPVAVQALAELPGVEVIGDVVDVEPYLAEAGIVAIPLRAGGGTKLKTLEAMAAAKPVVSTSVGVEGLNVTAGRDVLVADGAESFAATLIDLCHNPQYARDLGSHAVVAARQYDWKAIRQEFERVVAQVMAEHSCAR